MLEDLAALPLPVAAAALWAFALVRGAVYYGVGRLSRGRPGGRLEDWAQRLSNGRAATAAERIERLGPRAIILCYPVYGLSAATQIVAGGVRMPLPRFYLALAVPALLWATLQAVIGVATVRALVTGHLPWLLLAGAGVVAIWLLRRSRRRDDGPIGAGVGSRPPGGPA